MKIINRSLCLGTVATFGMLQLVAGTASADRIAYYDFNDADPAGGLFADTGGFASPSDLTIVNYATSMRTSDPWGGQALTFDGTSQYGYIDYPHNVFKLYRMGTNPAYDGTSQGALEFWYNRPTGSPSGGFMMFHDDHGYNYENYRLAVFNSGYFPDHIAMVTADGTNSSVNYDGGTTLTRDSWNHVVMTWDGTTQYLYENGALTASGSQVGPLLEDVPLNFQLGRMPGIANMYTGSIDELSMWNSNLTAAEVAQHYQDGLDAMGGTPGDFNDDDDVNVADIDLLCEAIRNGGPADPYDIDGNPGVNMGDLDELVQDIIGTNYGDSDVDTDVDLSDLGNLATNYEQAGPHTWGDGDFDCDEDVDLSDLGSLATNYSGGQATAYAEFSALTGVEVPEPVSLSILSFSGLALARRGRRSRSM